MLKLISILRITFQFHMGKFMRKYTILFLLSFCTFIGGESITRRFLENHGTELVYNELKEYGVSDEMRQFFEEMIAREGDDLVGYHCSQQPYRIYQDIIRIVVEEVLGFEVPPHFHFVRIPGDPKLKIASLDELFQVHPPTWGFSNGFYDEQPGIQIYLLSLNTAIFSNYNVRGESSIVFFISPLSDESEQLCPHFAKLLTPFFTSLGLPAKTLPSLFDLGAPLMEEGNAIMLQFFDRSAFELTEKIVYPSLLGGQLDTSFGSLKSFYLEQSHFPLQLRLFVDHKGALNPYGSLHIYRWDRVKPEISAQYEASLRSAIRKLPFDKILVERYRHRLLQHWQINTSQ